jgi:hypothetical protein
MHIEVETIAGPDGSLLPRKCAFDGKHVEVAELLDQWHGDDYRYVKFRGDDANLYILRCDDLGGNWELTMYETPRAHGMIPDRDSSRQAKRKGDGAAEE